MAVLKVERLFQHNLTRKYTYFDSLLNESTHLCNHISNHFLVTVTLFARLLQLGTFYGSLTVYEHNKKYGVSILGIRFRILLLHLSNNANSLVKQHLLNDSLFTYDTL